jgi:futalosine hydrolase
MRILIVTAVDAEAKAIGRLEGVDVIAGGIGRTNAAAATTESLIRRGPFDAVISAGVAGALPPPGGASTAAGTSAQRPLTVGDVIVASACIYHEEGLITGAGFANIAAMGFALGDFEGNIVPVDDSLLEALGARFPIGPIATVATCSGTDAAAAEVARRTGAIAEAMEGASVVHAARRLNVPAIEVRSVSNVAGERTRQQWNLQGALEALGSAMRQSIDLLRRR